MFISHHAVMSSIKQQFGRFSFGLAAPSVDSFLVFVIKCLGCHHYNKAAQLPKNEKTRNKDQGKRRSLWFCRVCWGDEEETLEGAGARPGDTQPISSRGRGSRRNWLTGNRKRRGDRVLKEGAVGGGGGGVGWKRRQNLKLKTQRNKIAEVERRRGGGEEEERSREGEIERRWRGEEEERKRTEAEKERRRKGRDREEVTYSGSVLFQRS